MEVPRRIQAGANAGRNVEWVMVDRKISRNWIPVVPASAYMAWRR